MLLNFVIASIGGLNACANGMMIEVESAEMKWNFEMLWVF